MRCVARRRERPEPENNQVDWRDDRQYTAENGIPSLLPRYESEAYGNVTGDCYRKRDSPSFHGRALSSQTRHVTAGASAAPHCGRPVDPRILPHHRRFDGTPDRPGSYPAAPSFAATFRATAPNAAGGAAILLDDVEGELDREIDAGRKAGNNAPRIRRGGRAAECAGLENRFALRGNVGSNPTLSASGRIEPADAPAWMRPMTQRDRLSLVRSLLWGRRGMATVGGAAPGWRDRVVDRLQAARL